MLKPKIKTIGKKVITKTCKMLPPKGQQLLQKSSLCVLNSMGFANRQLSQSRLNVAVQLKGGLGDCIITFAWIQQLSRSLSKKIYIDVYVRKDFLPVLDVLQEHLIDGFYDDFLFDSTIEYYDLRLSICHFAEIRTLNLPRIKTLCPELIPFITKLQLKNETHAKFIDNAPYFDGEWASYCTLLGLNRWSELEISDILPFNQNSRSAIHIDLNHMNILDEYRLNDTKFITVHSGCDLKHPDPSKCTKIWPDELWNEFCKLFKQKYPEITIVQIGDISQKIIEGCDLTLCGKLSLSESAIVLKQSLIHIDGESGLVHLKYQLGGRSIVLFGPTPKQYFAYDNNINIISEFCSQCMWMTNDWGYRCPRGFSRPECMWAITPENVLHAVDEIISSQSEYIYSMKNPALYSSTGHQKYQTILDDICKVCDLEKLPISEHILGSTRTYIHASKQWEYPYAIDAINLMQSNKLRIADIGGGRGVLAWYLSQKGHDVTVYDINYLWDSGGNENIENEFFIFARKNGFNADYGSIFNIPADNETFDVITCISVVEHVPFKKYALKEMLRVLKPGGKLILTYDLVLTDAINRDAIRVEIFTPQSICSVLSEFGIKIETIYTTQAVTGSINDIKSDNVSIAPEMTVGGLIITKDIAPRS